MKKTNLKIKTNSFLSCVMDSDGTFTVGRGKQSQDYKPHELLEYCGDLMDKAKLNGVEQIETYIIVGNALEQYKLLYPDNNQKFKKAIDKSRFGMEYNSKARTALMNIASNADNIRKEFIKNPSIAFHGLDSLAKKARGYTRPTPKPKGKSNSKKSVSFKAKTSTNKKSTEGLETLVDMSLELVTLAISLGKTEAQIIALIKDNFKDFEPITS